MKYCQALRERRLPVQTVVLSRLGIAQEDILMQQAFAGMLKPSYVLVRDHRMRCVVLAIRGTHSMKAQAPSLNLCHSQIEGFEYPAFRCTFERGAAGRCLC